MVAFGRYQLFPGLRLLLRDGVRLDVGERALDVLVQLVSTAGQVVSKDSLLSRIWSKEVIEENSLQAQISSLRKILGDDRDLIATEFGRGYRFTGSVRAHRAVTSSIGAPQARVGLPSPRSPLIGRVEELLELNRLLATQTLCTLTGPAGIGKTRLAIEAASESSPCFPDGVYFADLSQLSAASVSPAISSALAGLARTSTQQLASHPGRALLVVDNCEHVTSACAAALERVLESDPQLSVLLTSQTPLGLDGEQVYRLSPLTLPPRTINAANARSYSAVELFVRRVTSADYHFELTETNVEQVTALCRALDGVPLALEIAAARVPSLGLAAVTEDLALSSGLLAAQKRQTPGRHRTLGDALQWSYQLLDSVEQAVFQELAIFPADFTVAAAERIVSTTLERPTRLVDVLCSLVDKSLITLQAGTQPIRYRYLTMLRAYALEQLANRTAAVTEKHARFVEQLTSQAQRDWTSLPTTQWKRQYEHLIDDIRAALDWSLSDSKRRASGLLILANSAPFWIQLSLYDECRQRITNVLEETKIPPVEERQEMMIQTALATSLTWSRGPVPANGRAWSRASDLALRLDDAETQLQAEYGLWLYHLRSGYYAQALQHGKNMADLAVRHRDQAALLTARRLIGTSHHFLGNHTKALSEIECMLDSYTRGERHGSHFRFGMDQRVAGWAFLSRILWLMGNTAKARRAAQIAIDEAIALDHACTLCCALAEGGCNVGALSGDVEGVKRASQQLIQVAGTHGLDFWGLYGSAFSLWAKVFQDPNAVSFVELRSTLETLQARGFDPAYSVFLSDFASAMLEQGRMREAVSLINARLAGDATGQFWNAPELMRVKARTLSEKTSSRRTPRALILQEALTLARAQGAKAWELRLTNEHVA
ncbi:winged helix-turn-helix domain-containing protein [Paraburkholderia sp. SEWSISQ10-3 4]|uniref:ATP-binding protein n=1 Tax=Paraburkholderia TaxID=1822464 RepID=UPI00225C351D|nr:MULTISPECIES: winged helix-turn-helix domain-containing protein [Paraburkholderia]MCX4139549.1 winged helix-turn-helix domain-containing protein [Paraburkholderia aspalathi]MDN7172236.1 winged helix-turn-helix domain-containing protein [Paraburkholderia sp. SEWSISQ10-3 4]MDQ6501875.1 winged helix-turn-helix domain-containing protein [Paraburkholderia aspalathi]